MKRAAIIIYTGLLMAIFISACRKKLEEKPRSILTPEFFSTTQGFQQGLDAVYASTRLIWGNQDYFTITVIGTDEFKRGIDGNSDINVYSSGYTPSTGVINANWRNAYIFINTCNGVIDNAPNVPFYFNDTKITEIYTIFLHAAFLF